MFHGTMGCKYDSGEGYAHCVTKQYLKKKSVGYKEDDPDLSPLRVKTYVQKNNYTLDDAEPRKELQNWHTSNTLVSGMKI
jgi:hypothetical protein